MITITDDNIEDLQQELDWFVRVLDTRFKLYFGEETPITDVFDVQPPNLSQAKSAYAQVVQQYELSFIERATLILSLIPHVRPRLLDVFYIRNAAIDRPYTEFGGITSNKHGFLPTLETLAFVLGGESLPVRFQIQCMFSGDHLFTRQGILCVTLETGQPLLSAPLRLSDEFLHAFTTGLPHRPDFSSDFPAAYIQTQLEWSDLVLHQGILNQILEIQTWIEHGDTLMNDWQLGPKLRPGYRCLFYGPPGTGKTMTACLLGKTTGRPVYKIDLSLIVSKYIGETEKNLRNVFEHAQNRGWILFFDEADALFGRRTETNSAHDRYANQEVSYLLQRIESFDGIVILATNFRDNMDNAFLRRFESIIYFPIPGDEQRLDLWQKSLPHHVTLDKNINLAKIAQDNTLSGGSIMNIVRYTAMQTIKAGRACISAEDLTEGIRRENAKEGQLN